MLTLPARNVVLGYSTTGVVLFLASLDAEGQVVYEPLGKAIPLVSLVPAIA